MKRAVGMETNNSWNSLTPQSRMGRDLRFGMLVWLALQMAHSNLGWAQTPTFEWVRRAGGSQDDFGQEIACDHSGNIYAVGFFQGTADFGTTNLTSAGDWDISIAKYARSGELLWVRRAGGPGTDFCYGIAVDGADNLLLTGIFTGSANFGAISVSATGNIGDMFVAKYDSAGESMWVRTAGADFEAAGQSVTVDGNGNVYVTGFFANTVTFGNTNLTSVAGADVFIAKYDGTGLLQWVQQAGGVATSGSDTFDGGFGIVVEDSGNLYVTGLFSSPITFGNLQLINRPQSRDIFLVKYDRNGVAQWARSFGQYQYQEPAGIGLDSLGNCYVAGGCDLGMQFENIFLTGAGGFDGFVAKYSAAGDFQWAHLIGGTGDDDVIGLAVDPPGNCYLIGEFEGTATFVATNLASAGSRDVFVVKLDSTGALRWAQRAGGPGLDRGFSVAVDTTGSPYVTGDFMDTASFGPFKLTSGGFADMFIAKLFGLPNASPAAGDDFLTTARDIRIVMPAATLLVNDTDPEGDPLTITAVSETSQRGGGVILKDGVIFYDPPTNYVGMDSFTYTVSDGPGDTATGSVHVTVAAGDSGPPPPAFQWVRQGGGQANGTNYIVSTAIAVDFDGNCYVTGQFRGVAQLGATNLTSFGGFDIYLAKYNNAGLLQWARQAGSANLYDNGDGGGAIAVDRAGNLYVTGFFGGTANFSPTNLVSAGASDLFIAKYDPAGALQWARQAGGAANDYGHGVAVDGAGNIYVTGNAGGNASFGRTNITGNPGKDYIFLAKYDIPGVVQWVRTVTPDQGGQGFSVAVDGLGNSYVSGQFYGALDFGSTNLMTTSGFGDAFLAKYDTGGVFQWARQARSTDYAAGGQLALNKSGQCYWRGHFGRDPGGNVTLGNTTLYSVGSADVFVAKFESDGTCEWARQAGGNDFDSGLGIAVDTRGSCYVTGSFANSAAFGNITLRGQAGDIFVANYDSVGTIQWAQRAGGSRFDIGLSIAVDRTGSCYLTGVFQTNATFGDIMLTATNVADLFVAKLAPPANSSPVARDDSLGTAQNSLVSMYAAKLLANDSDPDGDELIITGVSAATAQGGTASINSDSINYTPPNGFTGTDSFTYTVSDGRGGTATATVFVSVIDAGAPSKNIVSIAMNPLNDHPVIEFAGIPGRVYTIQTAATVTGPWSNVGTLTAGTNGLLTFEDPADPPPRERYYRTVAE